MAHPAQQQFCQEVKTRFPAYFRGTRVLEVGSRNINGSVRDLFEDCEYVGVDCTPGKDVDVVAFGHEFAAEPGSFDVACALETFEHDPFAEKTITRMLQLLRSEGLFFVTCASDGRREHGTKRQGTQYGPEATFYRNVTLHCFSEWIVATGVELQELLLRHDRKVCDLYCFAIKA